MTTREKIINLAQTCGMVVYLGENGHWDNFNQLEAFYRAVRNGALGEAAKACFELANRETSFEALDCAEAIRAMKETK